MEGVLLIEGSAGPSSCSCRPRVACTYMTVNMICRYSCRMFAMGIIKRLRVPSEALPAPVVHVSRHLTVEQCSCKLRETKIVHANLQMKSYNGYDE